VEIITSVYGERLHFHRTGNCEKQCLKHVCDRSAGTNSITVSSTRESSYPMNSTISSSDRLRTQQRQPSICPTKGGGRCSYPRRGPFHTMHDHLKQADCFPSWEKLKANEVTHLWWPLEICDWISRRHDHLNRLFWCLLSSHPMMIVHQERITRIWYPL